jgi:hypothetical protein
LESPILYVQNKILKLDMSPLKEQQASSEYMLKTVNFVYREPVQKNAIKCSFYIQNQLWKVDLIGKSSEIRFN